MKTLIITLILLSFIHSPSHAQSEVLIDTNTTASARIKFKENLISNTIEKNLSLPRNEENEKNWISAFWGMELILYRNKNILGSLRSALNDYQNRSNEFNRASLEAAYTLYPSELRTEVEKILLLTSVPKHYAMAFNYLNRISPETYSQKYFSEVVIQKFPEWKDNPILFMLNIKLNHPAKDFSKPPIVDLLSKPFDENKIVMFSFQRPNRNYPGLLMIRNSSGKFLRNDDGSLFHVNQLARAISNMPGYLTNGNTPQGIFSIQGIDTSQNYFIGRTPNIQLILPFETEAEKFFHTKNNLTWDESLYRSILPTSWKEYLPFYEAFYAGKAGRNEIIAHGTTIDLEYYRNEPYYPNTPTMGCLCALEIWDNDGGKRAYSDQDVLIKALNKLDSVRGYLVVVDVDDKNEPVTLNEVLLEILQAEKFFVK
jgi:hypothetical protein